MSRRAIGLRPLWRAPAMRFLAIGGACFALERWVSASSIGAPVASAERATIVLSPAALAAQRDAWQRSSGHPPTPAEEADLLQRAADEEILYREGLRLLDGRDEEPVRRRLVQLGRLLELGPLEDEPGLAGEARRLGLRESDPVIRRHLIETMRLALARPARGEAPDDRRVRNYVESHPERFAEPARVRLTHVYLSRDRHAHIDEDAARLLARLEREVVSPGGAAALGDPFVRGATLDLSPDALDRAFGAGFADRLAGLPVGRWSGPIESTYGLHAVWVHERVEPRAPELAAVRGRAVHALLADEGEARLRDRLEALRRRYRVELPQDSASGAQAGGKGLS